MVIHVDTEKLNKALILLRQNSDILSSQIRRLIRLEDRINDAWHTFDESSYGYIKVVQQLRLNLEKIRNKTDDEASTCTRIIRKVKEAESTAGGGSGGGGGGGF